MSLILISCSLSYAQSGASGNGSGKVKVTVVYPVLQVLYRQDNGAHPLSFNSGYIELGPFFPPALSECKKHGDGFFYKAINGWDDAYIPFTVEGAKGVPFSYHFSSPVLAPGSLEGVKISNANLKGSQDGVEYNPIPDGSGIPNAVLNVSEGKYYIQMHFATVWIRYACPRGERTFETTLTCEYL